MEMALLDEEEELGDGGEEEEEEPASEVEQARPIVKRKARRYRAHFLHLLQTGGSSQANARRAERRFDGGRLYGGSARSWI
jgi:hypothetical protein